MKYQDGFYTVRNSSGAVTDLEVRAGLVYIVNGGLGNGQTGKTLDELLSSGKLSLVIDIEISLPCLPDGLK